MNQKKTGFFAQIAGDQVLLQCVVLVALGIAGTVVFNLLPIGKTVQTLLVLVASCVAIDSGMRFSQRWMQLHDPSQKS